MARDDAAGGRERGDARDRVIDFPSLVDRTTDTLVHNFSGFMPYTPRKLLTAPTPGVNLPVGHVGAHTPQRVPASATGDPTCPPPAASGPSNPH